MEDFIKNLIYLIIGAILSKFIPEKNILGFYLKIVFSILIKYIMPAFFLYILFRPEISFDKNFIAKTLIFLSFLLTNLILDIVDLKMKK